ncbi:MAG TPA: hypothetical protein VKT33_04760 [Candidatus Angelobacter sp.]|nr:hypothetical protein [Candidatus Angelobacter sp.]
MSKMQLIYALWYGDTGILIIITLVLIIRNQWKKFPLFSVYCALSSFTGVALYLLSHSTLIGPFYWGSQTALKFLEFAVTYEVFSRLFAQQDALRHLAGSVLYWSLLAFLILGAVTLYTQPPVAGQSYAPALYVISEALRILEVGLLLTLLIFSRAFGVNWRQPVFGLALGMAVLATCDLAAIAVRAHFGMDTISLMNTIRGISFTASLLVWLGYSLLPAQAAVYASLPEKSHLEQWNQAVRKLNYQ